MNKNNKPLAEIMRPQRIEDIVGNSHLFSKYAPLWNVIKRKSINSMIFWGPPGVGKTTIARLLSNIINVNFIGFSATYSGKKEIQQAVLSADKALKENNNTILFIDEIHRFNKSQQDTLLPFVENGTFILIGATTENPSFEINSALLSRVNIFILNSLSIDDLIILINRTEKLYPTINLSTEIKKKIALLADGDGRRVYNLLQELYSLAINNKINNPDFETLNKILPIVNIRFDKQGEDFYNLISIVHKSVRGSDCDAAVYWTMRMLNGGVDPKYICRRIIRMAWEDIGLADPRAINITIDASNTYERLGSPEGDLAIIGAIIYLSIAPKSNAIYKAYNKAKKFTNSNPSYEVPLKFRNAPTKLMKNIGYGKGYKYPHEYKNSFIPNEKYFPDEMENQKFYFPTNNGIEKNISKILKNIKDNNTK